MNKIIFIVFAFFAFQSGAVWAQNYDSVSGATQKTDGRTMNLEQFKKALTLKNKTLVYSTVNEDGTPNSAVFGSLKHIENNVFAVGSMSDTKTTKINVKRDKTAILLLILDEKNEDGFYGSKVVLKYVEDAEKINTYRSKMEKSSDRTTFFTAEKFLIYR